LLKIAAISNQKLISKLLQHKHISLQVLRIDQVHPVISGNKIFKLRYFFDNIINDRVITFGGAYSNHLVATAFACKQKNIYCIGIIRGEKPVHLSHTLLQCIEYGMQLHFISRQEYDEKDTPNFIENLKSKFGDASIIPEGGFDSKGAAGAAEIMSHIDDSFTHICCAVGTATTIAGLMLKVKPHQTIIAFPVLKGMTDIEQRIFLLTGKPVNPQQWHCANDYHFGGYAKKNDALIGFMNEFYEEHQLPTDFVYTAKMMFGTMELIKNNFFTAGSKICCVHTGGLQGNLSLPKNTLTF
jgi:1-aminocyclopropane-1-carboxylate deaminase